MREKLGFSKPWISSFDRGGDLSVNWEFAVDGGGYQGGRSASDSLLFGVEGGERSRMSGAVEFSVGGGLRSSSLMRIWSMPRA